MFLNKLNDCFLEEIRIIRIFVLELKEDVKVLGIGGIL